MDTRDVRVPQENSPGKTIDAHGNFENKTPREEKTEPLVEATTHGHHSTDGIRRTSVKKKRTDLLLMSHPHHRHHTIPFGFIISALVVGTLALGSIIVLSVAARQVKTVDFYTAEAAAATHRLTEGAKLFTEHKFTESTDRFTQAKNSLRSIDQELWFIPTTTSLNFMIDARMQSVRAATKAALELAEAAEETSQLATAFTERLNQKPKEPAAAQATNTYVENPAVSDSESLTSYIKAKKKDFESVALHLANANDLLSKISLDVLPVNFKDEFVKAQSALTDVSNISKKTLSNFDGIMAFLGDSKPHTILVMLQNASELRPTGGFIGDLAFVQFDKGELTQQEVHDIYHFDHKLTEKIEPPGEIKLINDRWFMRDANSSIDFPTSAKNIASFLKKEGGPEVDTIMTVDQNVVANLLSVVGPLKIDELPAALTHENFEKVLSFIVEAKIYGREDPKVLLKSLLPALQKTTLESRKTLEVLQVLQAAVASKHIMAYSVNSDITGLIAQANAEGKARAADPAQNSDSDTHIEDFFAIVHYSIGGNKSDAHMQEALTHDTYINDEGSVVNEVTVKRTNSWSRGDENTLREMLKAFGFDEIPPHVLSILGKSFNIHMLRMYAPKGSELVDNHNPNISTHFDGDVGATYFSLRMEVAPGDSNTLKLSYKLPNTVQAARSLLAPTTTLTYNLNVVKQPGQDGVIFQKRLFPPNGMKVEPRSDTTVELTNDSVFKAIFTR